MFYIVSLIVTPAAQRQLLTNLYQEVDLRHIVFYVCICYLHRFSLISQSWVLYYQMLITSSLMIREIMVERVVFQ
jgi:hypothetical protein